MATERRVPELSMSSKLDLDRDTHQHVFNCIKYYQLNISYVLTLKYTYTVGHEIASKKG